MLSAAVAFFCLPQAPGPPLVLGAAQPGVALWPLSHGGLGRVVRPPGAPLRDAPGPGLQSAALSPHTRGRSWLRSALELLTPRPTAPCLSASASWGCPRTAVLSVPQQRTAPWAEASVQSAGPQRSPSSAPPPDPGQMPRGANVPTSH